MAEPEPNLITNMRIDALKQYAKLRQQLTDEKSQLETRLNQINAVLGSETTPAQAPQPAQAPVRRAARRGRKPRAGNTMSMREAVLMALSNGPVARKDLVKAVEGAGYRFNTKNPLNSIGSVLYAKNGPVKSKDGQFFVQGGAGSGSMLSSGNGSQADTATPKKKKRKMSAAGRARIAAAAKAMWARRKAGK